MWHSVLKSTYRDSDGHFVNRFFGTVKPWQSLAMLLTELLRDPVLDLSFISILDELARLLPKIRKFNCRTVHNNVICGKYLEFGLLVLGDVEGRTILNLDSDALLEKGFFLDDLGRQSSSRTSCIISSSALIWSVLLMSNLTILSLDSEALFSKGFLGIANRVLVLSMAMESLLPLRELMFEPSSVISIRTLLHLLKMRKVPSIRLRQSKIIAVHCT